MIQSLINHSRAPHFLEKGVLFPPPQKGVLNMVRSRHGLLSTRMLLLGFAFMVAQVVVLKGAAPMSAIADDFLMPSGEVLLGETVLNTRVRPDVDVIRLGSCPNFSTGVKAVRLEVLVRDADIDSFGVVYGNGMRDELPVRERFARGSSSRWIDLRGTGRCIEKIWVVGDTDGGLFRRARVRVHGLR